MVGIFDPACELLPHGQRNYKDTKPEMSSLLVFNRVYRLEIQSVMLVFSSRTTFSLTSPPSPLPKVNVQYIQTVCGCGGLGVFRCVVAHILQ